MEEKMEKGAPCLEDALHAFHDCSHFEPFLKDLQPYMERFGYEA